MKNLLIEMGAATTMAFALSSSVNLEAADYVKKTTGPLGIFDYTKVKHTEIGIVGYKNQRKDYPGLCGSCTTVIQRIPVYGEIVTSRSLTISLHPKEKRCLTSICSPCTDYTLKNCNPCEQGYLLQPRQQIIEPQYQQQRTESILKPVPERKQEPTLAPVPQARPPMLPPPLPEPPKDNGPELIIPR